MTYHCLFNWAPFLTPTASGYLPMAREAYHGCSAFLVFVCVPVCSVVYYMHSFVSGLCLCGCIQMCMLVSMHVSACGGQRLMPCFPWCPSTSLINVGPSPHPELIDLTGLTNELQVSTFVLFSLWLHISAVPGDFSKCSGYLNSGPHGCMADTLLNGPTSQPHKMF